MVARIIRFCPFSLLYQFWQESFDNLVSSFFQGLFAGGAVSSIDSNFGITVARDQFLTRTTICLYLGNAIRDRHL